ncbi:MAG: spore germination protein [Clostridia bacterium]|nr:spore germination protein [Clostridia bacterium]
MPKRRKILFKLIIFIIFILSIAGCWNRRELDTLAIVFGVGIDKAKKPGNIEITAQVIKPGEMKSPQGGSGGGGEKPYWNLTSSGKTIFSAVREFTHKSNRKLYFPHNEIIIFSEDIAKEGIRKYMDFFIRDPEIRRLVWVLVAKGNASEVLETKAILEKVPARNIAQLIEARAATSQASAVRLQEFLTRLMSKTTAPIASVIEITREKKEKIARLIGTAVFKDDKLVGYLNKSETRGLLWVIGEVKSGIIVVKSPGGNGEVSLEIIHASSKIIPEIKDNNIHIRVEITEEGNLGEQTSAEDLTSLPAWTVLERRQSEAIHNEVRRALKKAQELNTDIFAFGEAVHRKYPELWKDIENRWDEYFPNIEVTINVNAKLRRSGMTTKPPKPE